MNKEQANLLKLKKEAKNYHSIPEGLSSEILVSKLYLRLIHSEQTKINKKVMNSRKSFSRISRTITEVGETSRNNDRLLRQADKYET